MPTGYTAGVADGTIADVAEYLRPMARAFGFMIEMRDEPADAPWPDRFEPSTYNANRLAEAKAALTNLSKMLPDEMEEAAQRQYDTELAERRKSDAEAKATRARYEAMLARVRAWTPSTDPEQAMSNIRKFAIKQLEESISFDCDRSWREPVVRQTGAVWHAKAVSKAQRDVAYHTEEAAKEVERTNARNACLAAFRAELAKLSAPNT